VHTSTGVALGGSGVLREVQVIHIKPKEHCQQGLVKDGNHLGGSSGGSSRQIRMASGVWPIASTWMRVESRSKSRLNCDT